MLPINKNTNIQLNNHIDSKKIEIGAIAALTAGIAMVVLGVILASGLWGGGTMYFLAGGFGVGSIVCFVIAKKVIENTKKAVAIQVNT